MGEHISRKLAAILSCDVAGYSRLMGDDEAATVRTLETYREVIINYIREYSGRVVDSPGDNLLAEFASAVDAVNCAVEIQRELSERNTALNEHRKMEYRIGINVGDVIQEGERIYGDGINIAARMESIAEPGGICITGMAYHQVKNKLNLEYRFLGKKKVKNIKDPVPVYRVLSVPDSGTQEGIHTRKAMQRHGRQKKLLIVAALIVVFAVAVIWNFFLPTQQKNAVSKQTQTFPDAKRPPLAIPDTPSIAVLPFVNMSDDPNQDYFSDGITEDLITDLSKISGLFVIARNSVFVFKGQAVNIAEVARELGVRYILEGSVRKAGNNVRITSQLIDASTQGHIWAERYDRQLIDIFKLQDEVTHKIVSALAVKITEDERNRLIRKETDNLVAYDYTLRGLALFSQMTMSTNDQAREMFTRAIALDPEYALAYALIGRTYMLDWTFGWSQDPQSVDRAFELSQRALDLDDTQYITYHLLGDIYLWQKQHDMAISSFRKAIAIDPNDADGFYGLGTVFNWTGKPEEASRIIKKAMRLNPKYPVEYLWALGHAYFLMREYSDAIDLMTKVLDRNPNFLPAHPYLAVIYQELDRKEEARAQAALLEQKSPDISLEAWKQRLPYKNKADLDRIFNTFQEILGQ